jgi:hypothetical protein
MVTVLIGAASIILAQGSAGTAQDYVARFDCSIQSSFDNRPFGEDYRETITISRWSDQAGNVAIRRRSSGSEVDDVGNLSIQRTPEGRLSLLIWTAYAVFGFTEIGGTDGRFRYSGNRLVMDLGGVGMDGLCQADIRTRPDVTSPAMGRAQ